MGNARCTVHVIDKQYVCKLKLDAECGSANIYEFTYMVNKHHSDFVSLSYFVNTRMICHWSELITHNKFISMQSFYLYNFCWNRLKQFIHYTLCRVFLFNFQIILRKHRLHVECLRISTFIIINLNMDLNGESCTIENTIYLQSNFKFQHLYEFTFSE